MEVAPQLTITGRMTIRHVYGAYLCFVKVSVWSLLWDRWLIQFMRWRSSRRWMNSWMVIHYDWSDSLDEIFVRCGRADRASYIAVVPSTCNLVAFRAACFSNSLQSTKTRFPTMNRKTVAWEKKPRIEHSFSLFWKTSNNNLSVRRYLWDGYKVCCKR